jgi:hypothetical protein
MRRSSAATSGATGTCAGYLKNLFAVLEADPVRGREILSRLVAPIVMTPEVKGPARRYRATGAFNLAYFLGPAANGSGKSSCAGPLADLYTPLEVALFVRTRTPPDRRHLPETWRRATA